MNAQGEAPKARDQNYGTVQSALGLTWTEMQRLKADANAFRTLYFGTRPWKDVNDAEKLPLVVKFRNESEFKTQLEAAEGDGRPTYTQWVLWKARVQTPGDRSASPSQTAISTSVTITDPSDTSPEGPVPIGARRSTPDDGKEASQPATMFDPVRNE